MASEEFEQLRLQLAVLKESHRVMEATAAQQKAESDSAIERLRTSFEGLRADIAEQSKETLIFIMAAAGLVIASVGVAAAILGVVLSGSDASPQPIILYPGQPAAVSSVAAPPAPVDAPS